MNKDKTKLEEELDDDAIREWFASRDPNRPKVNPFLTDEAEESVRGKASSLTIKKEEKEKLYGISYSQHTKSVREVARHFFLIGSAVTLFVAIVLALIF